MHLLTDLVVPDTFPYNWLVGSPGLLPTGTMSGFRCELKMPAAHVKELAVLEVSSASSW